MQYIVKHVEDYNRQTGKILMDDGEKFYVTGKPIITSIKKYLIRNLLRPVNAELMAMAIQKTKIKCNWGSYIVQQHTGKKDW